jgi:hypothetical protein
VVRGWGADYRSQLIAFGVAFSFEELKKLALDTPFPIEGTSEVLLPSALLIDSGYRKDDVVKFAQGDGRVLCTKGASGKVFQPYRFSKAFHQYGVRLAILDTETYKDRLHTWMKEDRWQVHNQITDEYCQHMASEHKIAIRNKGKGRISYQWDTVTQGAANHYWDCEVYQAAAADICNVWLIPDETALQAQRQARVQQKQQQPQQQQQQPRQGWISHSGKGWLK